MKELLKSDSICESYAEKGSSCLTHSVVCVNTVDFGTSTNLSVAYAGDGGGVAGLELQQLIRSKTISRKQFQVQCKPSGVRGDILPESEGQEYGLVLSSTLWVG